MFHRGSSLLLLTHSSDTFPYWFARGHAGSPELNHQPVCSQLFSNSFFQGVAAQTAAVRQSGVKLPLGEPIKEHSHCSLGRWTRAGFGIRTGSGIWTQVSAATLFFSQQVHSRWMLLLTAAAVSDWLPGVRPVVHLWSLRSLQEPVPATWASSPRELWAHAARGLVSEASNIQIQIPWWWKPETGFRSVDFYLVPCRPKILLTEAELVSSCLFFTQIKMIHQWISRISCFLTDSENRQTNGAQLFNRRFLNVKTEMKLFTHQRQIHSLLRYANAAFS